MRTSSLLLALALGGCTTGTDVTYNPTTGEIKFCRGMLGGPVQLDLEMPNGVKLHWSSDVNYEDFRAIQEARIANVSSLIGIVQDLAPMAAKGATP